MARGNESHGRVCPFFIMASSYSSVSATYPLRTIARPCTWNTQKLIYPQAHRYFRQERISFTSPLYSYFFAPDKLEQKPYKYLASITALHTICSKLSYDYHPDQKPSLKTLLDFINLHRKLGSKIEATHPHSDGNSSSVNLMTAHKSKGLEFETVYIVGGIDSTGRACSKPK